MPKCEKMGAGYPLFPTIGLPRALLQPVATNGYALSSRERLLESPPPTARLVLLQRNGMDQSGRGPLTDIFGA